MRRWRLVGTIAVSLVSAAASAQTTSHHAANPPSGGAQASPYRNKGHSNDADMVYGSTWGVDQLKVRRTSSGELIRFSYRVVDVKLAKTLHDKKAEPHLIGLRSHAILSVPTLENVGQLRQSESLEQGKDYWVLFSNKGDLVKVGDRVDVVIGDFYVSNLTVE